jgi:hypothetical protein
MSAEQEDNHVHHALPLANIVGPGDNQYPLSSTSSPSVIIRKNTTGEMNEGYQPEKPRIKEDLKPHGKNDLFDFLKFSFISLFLLLLKVSSGLMK